MRSSKLNLASMVAMAAFGMQAASEATGRRGAIPLDVGYGGNAKKPAKRYPQMVVSPPAEIAEWNRNIKTRQVLRYEARHA
jgi:hypothetical protein